MNAQWNMKGLIYEMPKIYIQQRQYSLGALGAGRWKSMWKMGNLSKMECVVSL